MHVKRVTYASVIAIGLGASMLTAGANVANAQGPQGPQCPPGAGYCQGGPGNGPPPQQGGQGDGHGGQPPQGPQGPPGDGHDGGQPPQGGQGGPPFDDGPGNGPGDFHGNGPGNGPGDFHGNGPGNGPDWRGPDYHGGPGGPQWGPPPPDLAWRSIDQGRYDHQPFNYNGQWVEPIYNQNFNNWGFWFLGIWIPL